MSQSVSPRPGSTSWLFSFPLMKPLGRRNYLLLFVASSISYVGANLTLVAFPWLVLAVTDDALAMGTVMAVAGIPRAAFMLFGGAATDHFSPRTMMLISTVCRLLIMLVLASLTLAGVITFWQIMVIALLFGTLDAFYWPASTAILPMLLEDEELPAGNALLQGCAQISLMLGPVIAGSIIALMSDDEMRGIALVFFLDTAGFFISALALFLMRPGDKANSTAEAEEKFSVWQSLGTGMLAMWNDVPVRIMTLVLAAFTLFFRGPHMVGLPVLADARFEEGALAYGMIMSAFGVGALAGIVSAGSLPTLPERWLGRLFLVDLLILGASFIVYAATDQVYVAMAMSAASGLIDGYFIVVLMSWLQRRIEEGLLGRVMSVIMFCNNGLVPISAAAAGWFLTWSIEGTFYGAGAILVALCIGGLLVPVVRRMGL